MLNMRDCVDPPATAGGTDRIQARSKFILSYTTRRWYFPESPMNFQLIENRSETANKV